MKVNVLLLPISLVILILLYFLKKERSNFKTLQQQNDEVYNNTYRPNSHPEKNNEIVDLLKGMINEQTNHFNHNGGANISVKQNRYDLIFKDIVVSSDKRNKTTYPNPNTYTIRLNTNIDKIYKAELIDVYVPAATDDAVNIPTNGNRLYFGYQNTHCDCSLHTEGYIIILAGTYSSPDSIACELQRQFDIVLKLAGFDICNELIGIQVFYDKNLNRYIFADKNQCESGTIVIFPDNGFIIDSTTIVTNSIADYLMLNYTTENITKPYMSGPRYINSVDNVLFVDIAYPGDYGEYSNNIVQPKFSRPFGNCIMSDVVLTNCKLFLSLGKLNGDTCNIVSEQGNNNVNNIFCQIPNNTIVSSNSVKTLLNQPHNYSSIQFYNPPISRLNRFEVKWYTENGELIRILDHCFTIRIYYFQKRIDTTDFSSPIP